MNSFTRRDVLKLGAAALATSALSCSSVRKPASMSDAFTFALISDTHLGKDSKEDASNQFKQAIAEINSSDAEMIFMCGDLVHGGQNPKVENRYDEWRQLSSTWSKPWHAVPGNHDPDALFIKHIQADTNFVIDRAPYRFICFRDAIGNPNHQGVVTREQMDWMQKQIDEARRNSLSVFLLSHIIYHQNQDPDVGWMIQQGRAEFADLLQSNARSIQAFFAGHFHEGMRGWSDTAGGIQEIVLPSNCWNSPRKNLISAPGWVETEIRPGWTLATVSGNSLLLRYKPLSADVSLTRTLMLKTATA